jgi:V8-like Glu-specific endopeptidase
VLIGPRHVLTASHCVDWNTAAAETIEVHRNGATVSATAFDTNAIAYKQITTDPGYTEMDEDYAVLVLDQRLGDRFGWMGCKQYDSGWDDEGLWTTIGYPGDLGGLVPTFQNGVSLDEDEFDFGAARAMTTNADLKPGQSGSPVFGVWADGIAYVVAVVSSNGAVFFSGAENWCSGGSELNDLIRSARQDHP